MARYIDADALIERLKFKRDTDINRKKYSGLESAISQVSKQPTADVVEVVRCKDCKRYIKGHAGEQSNYCDCHTTTFEKFFCMPNDYCSCGERYD